MCVQLSIKWHSASKRTAPGGASLPTGMQSHHAAGTSRSEHRHADEIEHHLTRAFSDGASTEPSLKMSAAGGLEAILDSATEFGGATGDLHRTFLTLVAYDSTRLGF